MRKTVLALVLAAISMLAAARPVKYNLKGEMPSSLNNAKVIVYAIGNDRTPVDSTVVKGGRFALSGTWKELSVAQLMVKKGKLTKVMLFALEDTPVEFTYDGENLHATGGSRTSAMKEYDRIMREYGNKMSREEQEKLVKEYRADGTSEVRKAEIMKMFDEARRPFNEAAKKFLKENNGNIVGGFYYSRLYNLLSKEEDNQLMATAGEEFLSYPTVKSMLQQREAAKRQEVGQKFTDFEMADKDGKMHKLSEYIGEGKYVLLDFWASWCGPCRAEMPNVKAAYAKYHEKGFDIVGVSLDSKRDAWLKAIDDMQMPWHHLSDLKGWDCAASTLYGVNGIPCTLLIGSNGKIIARNLRGEALGDKLADEFGMTAPGKGVVFNEDKTFAEVLALAKKEGKPVFVDCYTEWCGPCKIMANKEFPKKEAGDYFNEKFVCWELDMEKGEGPELLKKYDVNAFPTFLILDAEGNLIGRIVGYAPVEDFIQRVDKVLKEEKNLPWYQKKFAAGERDETFLQEYVELLNSNHMRNELKKVTNVILASKTPLQIVSDKTLYRMFQDGGYTPSDDIFLNVYKERARIVEHQGVARAELLDEIWKQNALACISYDGKEYKGFNKEKFEDYQQKMKDYGVPYVQKIVNTTLLANALYSKDYKTVCNYLKKDIKSGGENMDDRESLYTLQTLYNECKDDKKVMDVVKKCANQRIEKLKASVTNNERNSMGEDRNITVTNYMIEQFTLILK